MGYGEGLGQGINMGLSLLNAMDNRRRTAIQEKRQAALDKRNELIFKQQQEDRQYDRTVLRPMREKTARMGLSALESDIDWKGKNREHTQSEWQYQDKRRTTDDAWQSRSRGRQEENWQYQDEQRDFNNKKSRWSFEYEQDKAKREQYQYARKEHELNIQKGQQALNAAMQSVENGNMDSAMRYAIQAQEMGIPLDGMFAGQFGSYAGLAKEVSTGQRSMDDPEFKQATRQFMNYTMKASGRADKYDFDSLEQLPNGRFAMRLKPKYGGEYNNIIESASRRFGIDADMIRAMVWKESLGKKNARSNKGAAGLMQLMPDTAKEVAAELGIKNFNPDNPEHNIMAGTYYFSKKLKEFKGDPKLALAAYNAGAGAVRKYKGIPPFKETQNYVPKILGQFQKLKQGVPATRGMSSDKTDHMITRSREDLVATVQHAAQTEAVVNERFSPEFKQAFLQQLQAAGIAQGMSVPTTKQKEHNYKYDKDLGGLYDTKTGEMKTINGGIAGGDSTVNQTLTANLAKDDPIYPYAELIDRQNPEMSLSKKSARLKQVIGEDIQSDSLGALDKNMRLNREQSTKSWLLESLGQELAQGDIDSADIEGLASEIAQGDFDSKQAETRVIEHLKEKYMGNIESLKAQINYSENVYNYPKGHPEHKDIAKLKEKLKRLTMQLDDLEKTTKKES